MERVTEIERQQKQGMGDIIEKFNEEIKKVKVRALGFACPFSNRQHAHRTTCCSRRHVVGVVVRCRHNLLNARSSWWRG